MANNKQKLYVKKEKTFSIRCTEDELNEIDRLAKENNQSRTEYILDSRIPQRKEVKNNVKRKKEQIKAKVEMQQTLNNIHILMSKKNLDSEIVKYLMVLEERSKLIWDF